MTLQTLQLEHVPSTHSAHVALYRDVRNAAFLHSQLLSRNAEFEYAFIDASMVCRGNYLDMHAQPLSVRALTCWRSDCVHHSRVLGNIPCRDLAAQQEPQDAQRALRDGGVHLPVQQCASPEAPRLGAGVRADVTQIAEAYRRFGIGPATKHVIVVKVTYPTDSAPVSQSAESILQHLTTHVEGEATDFTEEAIAKITDWSKVRKYYKLNGLGWLDALPEDRRRQELEMMILGSMAVRGV